MQTRYNGNDTDFLPAWLPDDMRHYLAHTGAGLSIRDIARRLDCHASTISRRIARIEQLRDDPLIDLSLSQFEARLKTGTADVLLRVKREIGPMTKENDPTAGALQNLEKEALRILRRLCETGAVLAIAEDMDTAVVVREGPDGATTRTAVVAQEVAQAMALQGWIDTNGGGRILRYRITGAGRDKVKDLLASQEQTVTADAGYEMAEAPARFDPAPRMPVSGTPDAEQDASRKLRYNLAESPLTVLARRRDKAGEPFLTEDLVRCGERLREDFELAQMGPQMAQNWTRFLTAGVQESDASGDAAKGYGPEAAKARVISALRELGPGLSDVALRCCCYLEGLESTEKRMGWSARSGKIVLRIALQRLQRHYAETLTPEAQMIG